MKQDGFCAAYSLREPICGGVAGCTAKTVVAPLSRLTMLMQVQFTQQGGQKALGLWHSFQNVRKTDGFLALWRGNTATLVHRFPYSAVGFWVNAKFNRFLERCEPSRTWPADCRHFIAGGVGATVSTVICYPLDLVRTRLTVQSGAPQYGGTANALSTIYKKEGFGQLYHGLGASVFSAVPAVTMSFAFFPRFQEWYRCAGVSPAYQDLLAGASSGAVSSVLTFPLDSVRRQIQVAGLRGRAPVYRGMFDVFSQIYRSGRQSSSGRLATFRGLREFFRGLAPELAKVVPSCAILFSVNNHLMETVNDNLLENMMERYSTN